MVWSGRRGAPRQMPYDDTSLRGGRVDVDARVAWLLRSTRMASPLGGTGADFCARLADLHVPLDQAGLTRREQGKVAFTASLITAYEAVLELPAGHLLGVCDNMVGGLGHHLLRPVRVLGPHAVRIELERISQLVRAGGMTGGDWLSYAHLTKQPGGIVLPAFLQDDWHYCLVEEMSRSIGGAYIGRNEALCRLMRDPAGAASLTRVIREVVNEPGAQTAAPIPALALLGAGRDPASLGMAIEFLAEGTPWQRYGAGLAVLERVLREPVGAEAAARISAVIRQLAGEGGNAGDLAYSLAKRISPGLAREVIRELGRAPGDWHPGARIEAPAQLHAYLLACSEESGLPEDRMLERLLREALSDDFVERRHHALQMLSVSPYASATASTAARLVRESPDAMARKAAGHALSYLSRTVPAPSLVAMLSAQDPEIRAAGLAALAHGPGVPEDVDLRPFLLDPSTSAQAVYAAGMSGHPQLRTAAAGDVTAPVREAAGWWLRHGPAVTDGCRAGVASTATPSSRCEPALPLRV